MAQAIWYYAQEDREHGPVTGAYIAGMARTGKLRPDDLVWREGMEDWRPAKTIKGLFTSPGERPAGSASDTAVLDSPFEARPPEAPSVEAPPTSSGRPTVEEAPRSREEKKPLPGVRSAEPAPPPPPVEAAPGRFRDSSAAGFDAQPPSPAEVEASDLPPVVQPTQPPSITAASDWLTLAARAAIAVGLLLALVARGCEAVGIHSVGRLSAKAQLAARQPGDQPKAESQPNKQAPATGNLAADARRAYLQHQAWGLWREVGYLVGATVFTLGAFATAFFAHPRMERWIGLVLLAVMALSVFAGAAPGLHTVNKASASWGAFETQTN